MFPTLVRRAGAGAGAASATVRAVRRKGPIRPTRAALTLVRDWVVSLRQSCRKR